NPWATADYKLARAVQAEGDEIEVLHCPTCRRTVKADYKQLTRRIWLTHEPLSVSTRTTILTRKYFLLVRLKTHARLVIDRTIHPKSHFRKRSGNVALKRKYLVAIL